ncbi:hypothetical protein SDC9_174921 [bioreactor metagenome]|uniref:Uncharacterized protein n=1 Tax=bioreactor metagenome TaxID=1076179 RepID=A0A645GKS2_9ZZZZ
MIIRIVRTIPHKTNIVMGINILIGTVICVVIKIDRHSIPVIFSTCNFTVFNQCICHAPCPNGCSAIKTGAQACLNDGRIPQNEGVCIRHDKCIIV